MAKGRDEITTRIALEGGAEVKKQLQDLGQVGEDAIRQLDQATAGPNAGLAQLSKVTGAISTGFKSAGEALLPLQKQFSDLRGHVSNLGTSLGAVANQIFPHFKEVLALGAAVSAAGLFEIARGAVAAEHAVTLNARQLGVSVEQFRAYGRAAQQAGVDSDTFATAATRFNVNTQKIIEDQSKSVLNTLQEMVGKSALAGVQIIGQTGKTSSKLVANIGDNIKAASEFATRAMAEIDKSGQKVNLTFDQIRRIALGALTQGGDAAEKFALEMNKLGINVPVNTIFAQLERIVPGFTNELTKMGIALTKSDGQAKSFAEIFPEFLDGFAKIKSSQEQARIVQELWGRGALSLINLFRQGRSALKDFPGVFEAVGIKADDSSKSIDLLQGSFLALQASVGKVKKTVGLAFAEVFQPVIIGFTGLINDNIGTIKVWANDVANSIKPVVVDFINVLKNADSDVQNEWVKSLVNGIRQFVVSIRDALPSLGNFFSAIKSALDGVAAGINKVFGTDFNATALAAIVIIGSMTGAFSAMGAAVLVVAGLVTTFATVLTTIVAIFGGPAVGLIGGLIAVGAALLVVNDNWKNIIGTISAGLDVYRALWDLLKSFATWLATEWVEANKTAFALAKGVFDAWWRGTIDGINTLIGWYKALADVIKSVFGGAGAAQSAANAQIAGGAQGFAAGGRVRGASGIDRVPIWATAGEFVVNAFATMRNLPLLEALNGGMNIMPQRTRFATGGLVAAGAGGGGAPVHLHLDGGNFALRGDQDVVDALVKSARRAKVLSMGRKPSSVG